MHRSSIFDQDLARLSHLQHQQPVNADEAAKTAFNSATRPLFSNLVQREDLPHHGHLFSALVGQMDPDPPDGGAANGVKKVLAEQRPKNAFPLSSDLKLPAAAESHAPVVEKPETDVGSGSLEPSGPLAGPTAASCFEGHPNLPADLRPGEDTEAISWKSVLSVVSTGTGIVPAGQHKSDDVVIQHSAAQESDSRAVAESALSAERSSAFDSQAEVTNEFGGVGDERSSAFELDELADPHRDRQERIEENTSAIREDSDDDVGEPERKYPCDSEGGSERGSATDPQANQQCLPEKQSECGRDMMTTADRDVVPASAENTQVREAFDAGRPDLTAEEEVELKPSSSKDRASSPVVSDNVVAPPPAIILEMPEGPAGCERDVGHHSLKDAPPDASGPGLDRASDPLAEEDSVVVEQPCKAVGKFEESLPAPFAQSELGSDAEDQEPLTIAEDVEMEAVEAAPEVGGSEGKNGDVKKEVVADSLPVETSVSERVEVGSDSKTKERDAEKEKRPAVTVAAPSSKSTSSSLPLIKKKEDGGASSGKEEPKSKKLKSEKSGKTSKPVEKSKKDAKKLHKKSSHSKDGSAPVGKTDKSAKSSSHQERPVKKTSADDGVSSRSVKKGDKHHVKAETAKQDAERASKEVTKTRTDKSSGKADSAKGDKSSGGTSSEKSLVRTESNRTDKNADKPEKVKGSKSSGKHEPRPDKHHKPDQSRSDKNPDKTEETKSDRGLPHQQSSAPRHEDKHAKHEGKTQKATEKSSSEKEVPESTHREKSDKPLVVKARKDSPRPEKSKASEEAKKSSHKSEKKFKSRPQDGKKHTAEAVQAKAPKSKVNHGTDVPKKVKREESSSRKDAAKKHTQVKTHSGEKNSSDVSSKSELSSKKKAKPDSKRDASLPESHRTSSKSKHSKSHDSSAKKAPHREDSRKTDVDKKRPVKASQPSSHFPDADVLPDASKAAVALPDANKAAVALPDASKAADGKTKSRRLEALTSDSDSDDDGDLPRSSKDAGTERRDAEKRGTGSRQTDRRLNYSSDDSESSDNFQNFLTEMSASAGGGGGSRASGAKKAFEAIYSSSDEPDDNGDDERSSSRFPAVAKKQEAKPALQKRGRAALLADSDHSDKSTASGKSLQKTSSSSKRKSKPGGGEKNKSETSKPVAKSGGSVSQKKDARKNDRKSGKAPVRDRNPTDASQTTSRGENKRPRPREDESDTDDSSVERRPARVKKKRKERRASPAKKAKLEKPKSASTKRKAPAVMSSSSLSSSSSDLSDHQPSPPLSTFLTTQTIRDETFYPPDYQMSSLSGKPSPKLTMPEAKPTTSTPPQQKSREEVPCAANIYTSSDSDSDVAPVGREFGEQRETSEDTKVFLGFSSSSSSSSESENSDQGKSVEHPVAKPAVEASAKSSSPAEAAKPSPASRKDSGSTGRGAKLRTAPAASNRSLWPRRCLSRNRRRKRADRRT